MILQRSVSKYLSEWRRKTSRKPLIIRGARQIGKTTVVRSFGKTYEHFVEINLETSKVKQLFENESLDLKQILQGILINHGLRIDQSSMLIFIDEIQESPRAIQLLRYFKEDYPEIHVIATGSLLDHALGNLAKYPVGRVEYLYLYPLNFQEYLEALDNKSAFEVFSTIPFDNTYLGFFLENFQQYAIIGGMPEIVKTFLQNNGDYTELKSLYDDLLTGYKNDVEKYAQSNIQRKIIRRIIDRAPRHADKRVKLEKFGNSNYKAREVAEAMDALQKARILYLLYPQVSMTPPLSTNTQKRPRLQFLDTGLINYKSKLQSELITLTDLNDASRGRTIQHIVTQEFQSIHNRVDYLPSFWTREKKGDAEVDLVVQKDGKLIPIEVKSGKIGKLRSLFTFMDLCDHHYAIRFYADKLLVQDVKTINGKSFKLLNLPYFLGTKLYEYIDWFVEQY